MDLNNLLTDILLIALFMLGIYIIYEYLNKQTNYIVNKLKDSTNYLSNKFDSNKFSLPHEDIEDLKNKIESFERKIFDFDNTGKKNSFLERELLNLKQEMKNLEMTNERIQEERGKLILTKNEIKSNYDALLEQYKKEFEHKNQFQEEIKNKDSIIKNLEDNTENLLQKIQILEGTEIEKIKSEIKIRFDIALKLTELKQNRFYFNFDLTNKELEPKFLEDYNNLKIKLESIDFDKVVSEFANKNKDNLNEINIPHYEFIIPAIGDKFDNTIHTAIARVPSEIHKRDTIVEIISIGLKKDNKICKFAEVKATV